MPTNIQNSTTWLKMKGALKMAYSQLNILGLSIKIPSLDLGNSPQYCHLVCCTVIFRISLESTQLYIASGKHHSKLVLDAYLCRPSVDMLQNKHPELHSMPFLSSEIHRIHEGFC